MGAWGADTFENDDAIDFAEEVTRTNELSRVQQALDAVLDTSGYLEAPAASTGLAAADVVARLRGHFGQQDPYTEPIDNWVRTKRLTPDEPLVVKAQAVVDRVRTEPSELLELWSEDDPAEWFAALDMLKQRLAQPPPRETEPTQAKGLFSRLVRR